MLPSLGFGLSKLVEAVGLTRKRGTVQSSSRNGAFISHRARNRNTTATFESSPKTMLKLYSIDGTSVGLSMIVTDREVWRLSHRQKAWKGF